MKSKAMKRIGLTCKKIVSLDDAPARTFVVAFSHRLTVGKKPVLASTLFFASWRHGMRLRRFSKNIGGKNNAL